MPPIIEIDPQGSCFVCLSSANRSLSDDGENCELKSTAAAFKMLLRYLKVDVMKLTLENITHAPPEQVFPRGLNTASNKLSVSLCDDCSSVTNDFLELFQAFESIRLQLDLCVGQIHEFMEKGSKDPEKVRKYEGRIGDEDMAAQTNTKIMECLRQELMRKVSQRVHCSVPRISVKNCAHSNVEDDNDNEKSEKVSPTFPVENEIVEYPKPTISEVNVPTISESSLGEVIEQVENMDVDITNDHPKEPEPTLSKHGNAPHSKLCIFCERKFSSTRTLRTHMLSIHAFKFLSNEGLLPPTISEQDFDAALESVLEQVKPPVLQCPLCNKYSFRTKCKAKLHLLRQHLGYFMESKGKAKADMVMTDRSVMHSKPSPPVSSENGGKPHDHNPTKSWNCSPCGMRFPLQSDYYAHSICNHPAVTFASQLPKGTSDQDFNSAVTRIIDQGWKIANDNGTQMLCFWKCPQCEMSLNRIDLLKLHIVCSHLDKVIQVLSRGYYTSERNANLPPRSLDLSNKSSHNFPTEMSYFSAPRQTNHSSHPTSTIPITSSYTHPLGNLSSYQFQNVHQN